jgi:hypothetical protein
MPPGLRPATDLNQGEFAGHFFSVSCASAGNCSGDGNYEDLHELKRVLVAAAEQFDANHREGAR